LYAYPQGSEEALLRTAAQLSFINDGDPHYRSLLKRATLDLTLGDEVFQQEWQSYGFTTRGDNGQLVVDEKEEVRVLLVAGGEAVSREVVFAAGTSPSGSKASFLDWSDFLLRLEKNRGRELKVTLRVEQYRKNEESVRCKIGINDDLLNHLRKGWTAPACLPIDSK